MSSGTRFDYTTEERSVLLGQFSDVIKFAHEQLRPAARISLALQAAISDDDIIVVPKVAMTPTGKIFHVTSDVKVRTAADAINALDCPLKWGLAETPAKISMILHPVDCNARLVTLEKVTTTKDVYNLYRKIVTPAELFAFGAKFPTEQCEAPIFTVWLDANGQFCYAILGIHGDKRDVRVYDGLPDVRWHDVYRVLVRE